MKKVLAAIERQISLEEAKKKQRDLEYIKELKKAHSILQYMNTPIADWTEVVDGSIDVPDNLVPLFNKIGTQLRFHTVSGKGEIETIVSMVWIAQKFFHEFPKESEIEK